MDECFIDVTIGFLAVAFHSILYYTDVYPRSIFETRKKYSVVVYRSIHPEVNNYVDMCLRSITTCLRAGQLKKIEFAVTDSTYTPKMKFVFDIAKSESFDKTSDAYLVQCEQNMRGFCLKLSSLTDELKILPDDCSFTIYLHTNESTAVQMAIDPELGEFPLVETEGKIEMDKIIPLRRFSIREHCLDTYIELMSHEKLTDTF